MIGAIITYINRCGKLTTKGFSNKEEAQEFVAKLDKRIEKGTCGGYIMTLL